MTKTCTKCKQTKELSEFPFRKDSGNYRPECKQCHKFKCDLYKKLNDAAIKKQTKLYREKNKETLKQRRNEYRNSSEYKEYQKAYHKKWREDNRDERLSKKREYHHLKKTDPEYIKLRTEYRIKNKIAIQEQKKKDYENNKEYIKARVKKWQQDNPEKRREQHRRRKALKRAVQEKYTYDDELYTRNLFENKCANCSSEDHLQFDHHQPLSKGNALTRQNAVLLCMKCNISKKDKLPHEFYSPEKLLEIEKRLSPSPEGQGYSPTHNIIS